MNATRGDPKPQDDVAVEVPIDGTGRNQRTRIESPVDANAGAIAEAHTPRPHPPVEEPEENPEEHAPETEPDREPDPDPDSDQRRRPPRPGKMPR